MNAWEKIRELQKSSDATIKPYANTKPSPAWRGLWHDLSSGVTQPVVNWWSERGHCERGYEPAYTVPTERRTSAEKPLDGVRRV